MSIAKPKIALTVPESPISLGGEMFAMPQPQIAGSSPCLRLRSFVTFLVALISAIAYGDEARPAATKEGSSTCAAVPTITGSTDVSSVAINAAKYGLLGDGKTDNTSAINQALSATGRVVRFSNGDYVTGKFTIPANTTLILEPGTIIRDSGRLGPNDRLINIVHDNVHIIAVGAKVVASRTMYRTGEQRHGVFIWGAHNVIIDGLESSGHGGDGFYIGGPPGHASSAIILNGVVAQDNRRQGLSVTSARNVRVLNSRFTNTIGTPPQFGVDIEPDIPDDEINDISIDCVHTSGNKGGGIMIELFRLSTLSAPVGIAVLAHDSQDELVSLAIQNTATASGVIRYAHGRSTSAGLSAIQLLNTAQSGPRIEINDTEIVDNNVDDNQDGRAASGIIVIRDSRYPGTLRLGNVFIHNPTIIETRGTPQVPYSIWIQGSASGLFSGDGIVVDGLKTIGTREAPVRRE